MWKFLVLFLLISCRQEVVHPEKGQIVEAVYGLGIIKSEYNFHAKAAVLSSIQEFYVKEGDDVVKNQKLFLTDQGSLQKAPFSGRITAIPVTVGENLFPQTLILSLVDLSNLYLEVSLEQQGAMKLRKEMKAEISFEFFRNKKINGHIHIIYPKDDQFIAKVFIDEWPQGVLPGMSADVAFEVARKNDAILVPVNTIANGHITLLKNKEKKKFKVQIGLMDQEKAEILSPALSTNDEIIFP